MNIFVVALFRDNYFNTTMTFCIQIVYIHNRETEISEYAYIISNIININIYRQDIYIYIYIIYKYAEPRYYEPSSSIYPITSYLYCLISYSD